MSPALQRLAERVFPGVPLSSLSLLDLTRILAREVAETERRQQVLLTGLSERVESLRREVVRETAGLIGRLGSN